MRGPVISDLTCAFEAQEIDVAVFHHAEHVRVAFDLLRKYEFIDAAATYAKGIRTLAENAGAADKFNLTITYAFMSLIAERMATAPACGFDDFVTLNPDLMSKEILGQWYTADRLHSQTARSVFLLPKAG